MAIVLIVISITACGSDNDGTVAAPAEPTHAGTTDASIAPSRPDATADGWIVFQPPGPGLALTRLDGSGEHVILGPPGDQLHPDWSPDGERIVYAQSTDTDSMLWTTGVDGADAAPLHMELPDDLAGLYWDNPAWSRDGQRIAAVGYEIGLDDDSLAPTRSVLALVDVDSGAVEIASDTLQAEGLHSYPRWSPDGSALALNVEHFDEAHEFLGATVAVIRELDGGEWSAPDEITDIAEWARPDWHPTDDLIVFCDYDIGGFESTDKPSNLWTIRPDGNELRQVTTFAADAERASQPSWTSDGRIVFVLATGDNDQHRSIALIDADGTDMVVSVEPPSVGTFNRPHPRLQPTS